MKPRIFIGCSREGYATAERIHAQLRVFADCDIWDHGFFQFNRGTFETLAQDAVLYDFAILVASADDVQLKRGHLEVIARDNIIFEFGLYIGRLGSRRALLIKEKDIELPSDLFGVTLPTYKTNAADPGKNLDDVCADVLAHMQDIWNTHELSFVPSTMLAVGYFENFILRVCQELMEDHQRAVSGTQFKDFRLHIIVPSELPDAFHDLVRAYLADKKLNSMEVTTKTRKYHFYLDYAQVSTQVLELYDLPTTLSGLKRSIELALPNAAIGETKRQGLLKKKELNNFCRTLKYLVGSNAITKGRVTIDLVDI